MTRVITQQVGLDELDLRLSSLRLVWPSQVARLRASVARDGFVQPVLAATEVEPGRRVLVDGFKRVRVARELDITELSVRLLAIDGPLALAMMLRSNGPQRGMSALEEGWVLHRLCREHGLTQAEAGAMVAHDQSWVSHRLRLVEHLEASLQEDLRLGLLTPVVARELGRLPRGQQINAARAVREHGLSSRQAARLVQLLLGIDDDPGARQALLANPSPQLAIGPAAQSAKAKCSDHRLSPGGNELRRSLLGFEGAAQRSYGCSTRITNGGKGRRNLTRRQTIAAGRRVLAQLDGLCRRQTKGTADAPPPQ